MERKIWGWIMFGAGFYLIVDGVLSGGIRGLPGEAWWQVVLGTVAVVSLLCILIIVGWGMARSKPKSLKSFKCPKCGFTEGEEE